MISTRTAASITFDVDDVVPASEPVETCKPLDAVNALLRAPHGSFAADESEQGNPTFGRVEACWSYSLDCVTGIGHHALIAAAHRAFSGHRPLVLSPDVIWVTIAQGLAQHIRLNPEEHRRLLVSHEGKRKLKVKRDDVHRGSPENPWAEVVAEFACLLRDEVGEFADRFLCDFSTTGPVERTVSAMALLDALQPYFYYNVVCVCGIPSITLEGTADDWQRLREKVELLSPFGLDWWLSELRPICDQFARAANGDVDLDHWQRIYKIRFAYGAEMINGWLGKLFPYVKDYRTSRFSERNPLLDPEVEAEIRELEVRERQVGRNLTDRFDVPGVTADKLPRGLSRVPFIVTDFRGDRVMEFLAGPMVVTQDASSRALRPGLGWAVSEAPPIEQALAKLAPHQPRAAKPCDLSEIASSLGLSYLPTDVLRFYREVESVQICDEDAAVVYRISPLAEWSVAYEVEKSLATVDRRRRLVDDYCFAKLADGTELRIQLFENTSQRPGAVFVGHRHGDAVPETNCKVASSFTEFLLQALDGGSQPYFRRAGFALRCDGQAAQ